MQGRGARQGGEGSLRLRAEHARVGDGREGPKLTSRCGKTNVSLKSVMGRKRVVGFRNGVLVD